MIINYPYKHMSDFEKFKEEFYSVLTDRKINEKEYEYVLNFSKKN